MMGLLANEMSVRALLGLLNAMFWAIKPELLRLSKRQHLADFCSWGMKDGTWDDTKGHMNEGIGTIIKRR